MPEIFVRVSSNGEPISMLENHYSSVITYSQWTENFVQSGVLHQDDTVTKNSLAICSAIFRNDPKFAKLRTMQKHKNHSSTVTIDAYIALNKVADLGIDFNAELTEAQEHWHRNPHVAWDKLCHIWNKYGFLWPQKALLGYTDEYREWVRNRTPLNYNEEYTQHTFKIVWRTSLRPIYEFIPPCEADKKAFMIDMIQQYSSLIVLNDSLFKLQNEGSGYYLGRQQQQESLEASDKNAAVMVPVEGTLGTNQHLIWKFRDAGVSSPFIVLGSSLFLCSDHDETFLTKEAGLASSQTYATRLDHQRPSDSWHVTSKRHDLDNRNSSNTFHVDYALSRLDCLKDGDTVLLDQNSYFLRTYVDYFAPSRSASNSPANSFMSIDGELCAFFSTEELDSNVTQLTSDSGSSQEHDKGNFNGLKRGSNTSQTYPRHADLFFEKSEEGQMIPTSDYQWKIELVTANDRPKVAHYATRYEATIKQAPSGNKNHNKSSPTKEKHNKGSNNASSSTADKSNRKSSTSTHSTTKKSHRMAKETTRAPTPFLFDEPEQKSQWLDGYTKLYQLPKKLDDKSAVKADIDLSMNGRRRGSLKSMTSKEDGKSALLPVPPGLSANQLGKLPAGRYQGQQYQAQLQHDQDNFETGGNGEGDSGRTASPEPSIPESLTPTPKRIARSNSTTSTNETEAEAFKREVEQETMFKEEALAKIYAQSTSSSNTTSQIRYYDDEYDQPALPGSPSGSVNARNQSTPSSSANLSPEEYQARKQSRETSLLMLLRQETNYQVWVETFKHASISQWFLSKTKKSRRRSSSGQQSAVAANTDARVNATYSTDRPTYLMPNGDIRFEYYSSGSTVMAV
ncbi:hypothetical protein [Parasitella parasitica]|uniref:Uncharacterized protein n=1 Tax=Parasitella parasitica TaxID=35722 RepID=A0A0B7NJZ0_9FUNG|nr:hypothetical protein [Parasitella parasitica]